MSLTAKWDIKESQQREGIIRKRRRQRVSKVGEGIKEGTSSKSLNLPKDGLFERLGMPFFLSTRTIVPSLCSNGGEVMS